MRRIKNDCECTIDLQGHCGPTVTIDHCKLGDGSRVKSKLAEIEKLNVQAGGVRRSLLGVFGPGLTCGPCSNG
jgi:hypothetical protein